MSTAQPVAPVLAQSFAVRYGTAKVQGLDIFYREAGPRDAPAILLLHGFPSSSHMFRDLLPLMANGYRVVAPDYPGFGYSSAPSPSEFTYSFDRLAEVIDDFAEQVGLTRYAGLWRPDRLSSCAQASRAHPRADHSECRRQ